MRILHTCLSAALAAAISLSVASAASPPAIKSVLSAGLVTHSPAGTKISKVTALKPGEIVAYTAVYRNTGGSAAYGLLVKLPVPQGTTYVREGTTPSPVEVSADGKTFQPLPAPSKDDAAVLARYRMVEWHIGSLLPGTAKTVRIFVKVNAATAP
jgi:uncharacterized repeat protein (TIGR01451 family)